MTILTETARAKVNLALHVVGRRPDGYHLLDTLVVFPDIGDGLSADVDASLSLSVTGPEAPSLGSTRPEDNLVLRAARALQAAVPGRPGARIVLDKRLPVASGIGGGSADAAAALRLLVRLWAVDVEPSVLARIAAELGADVPMCLAQTPLRATGIGDVLVPLPPPEAFGILLVNPRRPVSTPSVFAELQRRDGPGLAAVPRSREDWLAAIRIARNDLEAAARRVEPEIGVVLAVIGTLDGALLARMSGSGATCFALFPDLAAARAAETRLAAARPEWWVRSAPVG